MKSFIKTAVFATFTSFLVFGQLAYAQSEDQEDENTDVSNSSRNFWEATLPGGDYMVSLSRVSAVSIHSYLVGKTLIVHEVNIQTTGTGLARFYTFEALGEANGSNIAQNLIERGKGILEQGGSRAGIDPNTTVEKEYPLTTHSHTIEYKLFDKADLDQLYSSIRRSLREGRGRKFTIR